jgi:hypothetical protein
MGLQLVVHSVLAVVLYVCQSVKHVAQTVVHGGLRVSNHLFMPCVVPDADRSADSAGNLRSTVYTLHVCLTALENDQHSHP